MNDNWRSLGEVAQKVVSNLSAQIAPGKAQEAFAEQERDRMIAEYRRRAVAPVFVDPDHEIVCSLELLMHMGWRIKRGPDGTNILVRPNEARA